MSDLGKIIKELQDKLHQKNIELDALGRVWCSGGCRTGAFRYTDEDQLTEEQVAFVEKNTKRLRTHFENRKARKARGEP